MALKQVPVIDATEATQQVNYNEESGGLTQIVQLSASSTPMPTQLAPNPVFSLEPIPRVGGKQVITSPDYNEWSGTFGPHLGFGGIAAGARPDELYMVFRDSSSHSVTGGATLKLSKSEDAGQTWAEPVTLVGPDNDIDLRDPAISYDSYRDIHFIVYTERQVGGPGVLKILRGRDPYGASGAMADVSPTMPPDAELVQNHDVVHRWGVNYCLVTRTVGTNGDRYLSIYLGSSAGQNWVHLTDIVLEGEPLNEACLYWAWDDDLNDIRWYIFAGLGPGGNTTKSVIFRSVGSDSLVEWERVPGVIPIGGIAPHVHAVGDGFVLSTRHGGSRVWLLWGRSPTEFSRPVLLAPKGPGYASTVNMPDGRILMAWTEERDGNDYARMKLAELILPWR